MAPRAGLFAACWLSTATTAPVVFEPPVLITAADNVGYADSAVGVSDSALLFAALSLAKWPNGSSTSAADMRSGWDSSPPSSGSRMTN